MKKIVITGGCGFIGSHIVEHFFHKFKKSKIIVLDKITYAASLENLASIRNDKRLIIYNSIAFYKYIFIILVVFVKIS